MTDKNSHDKIGKLKGILSLQKIMLSSEYEKRLCHLNELSSYLCEAAQKNRKSDGQDNFIEYIFEALSSYGSKIEFHSEILSENKHTVSRALNSLSSFDRAVLAQMLAQKWEKLHKEALNIMPLLGLSEFFSGRVSYVKNRYSDMAFDILSACIDEPRVVYAKNFRSVCEDISQGLSQYGILPLSDMLGRIETVNRLLSLYELKICAVCDVRMQNEELTRFALISDRVCVNLETENRYLSFSLVVNDDSEIQAVLDAISLYGLSLYDLRITPSISSGRICRFTVRESSGSLVSLAIYLTLFYPRFILDGIYFEI